MIKDVLSGLDYSIYAELALVLFFASFLGVLAQAWWSNAESVREGAELPLRDGERVSP
jgi:hypothetical protein